MPVLSLNARLSSLRDLHKPALADLWQRLFKTDPPPGMRKELMLKFVAYGMQEQAFGSLGHGSHRHLRELANAIEPDSNTPGSPRPTVKPGTRLLRQWKNELHIVNVEQDNYEYRGARYESLSEIARLITGTRWSGPLFFGLKNKPKRTLESK